MLFVHPPVHPLNRNDPVRSFCPNFPFDDDLNILYHGILLIGAKGTRRQLGVLLLSGMVLEVIIVLLYWQLTLIVQRVILETID